MRSKLVAAIVGVLAGASLVVGVVSAVSASAAPTRHVVADITLCC